MHFKKRLASSLLTFNISFQLYYPIVLLVLFHYRLKSEIHYIHSIKISGDTTLVSGDMTLGERTVGRLDRLHLRQE